MTGITTEEMPGADEAHKMLDAIEAADKTASAKSDKKDDKSQASVPKTDQHADPGGETDHDPSKATDAAAKAAAESDKATPANAAADAAAKAAEAAKTGKETKPAAEAGKGSRFSQAQARLQGGWSELNASKDALKAERDAFTKQIEADKAEVQRQRTEFESERSQAEQQLTPERYEEAAKEFSKRAEQLEAAGKFAEADKQKGLAEMAQEKAEQLRRNPPVKTADRNAAASKEWALKAGTDYPELMKDKSPMQIRVAQLLKDEPEFKSHPKGIYVAARIASLEAEATKGKAALASVAEKDAKIGEMQKRIKELEELTAPGGEGGAQALPGSKTFDQQSEGEQLAALSRDARAVGTL